VIADRTALDIRYSIMQYDRLTCWAWVFTRNFFYCAQCIERFTTSEMTLKVTKTKVINWQFAEVISKHNWSLVFWETV